MAIYEPTSHNDHMGDSSGEFSVCQFFPNGQYEYVRRWVSAKEAFEAFKHYISSVGAKIGTTTEVLITDGGDFCNVHWKFGEGIVYPTKEDIEKFNESKG